MLETPTGKHSWSELGGHSSGFDDQAPPTLLPLKRRALFRPPKKPKAQGAQPRLTGKLEGAAANPGNPIPEASRG